MHWIFKNQFTGAKEITHIYRATDSYFDIIKLGWQNNTVDSRQLTGMMAWQPLMIAHGVTMHDESNVEQSKPNCYSYMLDHVQLYCIFVYDKINFK
jgi:hypothetical protein